MPAGNGVSAYENLQVLGKLGLIPVIFLTASPSEELKEKVLRMGAAGFITKPFDPEELLKKIKDILGE